MVRSKYGEDRYSDYYHSDNDDPGVDRDIYELLEAADRVSSESEW